MALSIIQTPANVSLAQSPIIFAVSESNSQAFTSASFQYNVDLYYWTGAIVSSGSSPDYQLVKYPNESQVGIFDVSRILNSTLQQPLQANSSNVKYFAVDAYYTYYNGTNYVNSTKVRSSSYKYVDGYQLFQETIGQQIYTLTPHWPLMTDGPATQSAFDFNTGYGGVYVGSTGGTQPTKVVYTPNVGSTIELAVSSSSATSEQITQYPIGPATIGLSTNVSSFTVQAYNNSTALGTPITYNVTCNQKYPNIRIKWKNRYGQFDSFNFNMINRQAFSVNRSVYEPQIGSWGGRTLGYNNYDSSILNYLVDTQQTMQVNTDWVSEDYNDIFKQLLVSDEMYWVYDESNGDLRPITIKTNTIQLKTGVVDKTIQYSFDFDWGQSYKLII
jgi:hypothetical protein